MAKPKGHPCPECGAPREPDNTPSCACARRASEALREARTAQVAAAEDFDPLRIRPYVELDGAATAPGASSQTPGESSRTPGAPHATPHAPAPDHATSVLPTPLAPPAGAPSDTDLRLFEAAEVERTGPAGDDGDDRDGARPRRRRRGLLLTAAGGVVAVVAAAGYASGLFSYETPSRDSALPSGLRASIPDAPADAVSDAASGSASPSASPTSASPTASAGESASPSPSPSRSSASPSPSKEPAEPSAAPTVTATGTVSSGPDDGRVGEAAVLRRGDRGPEVTELQLRLRQLYLYTGDADGRFTDQVENSLRNYQWSRGVETGEGQLGVYGPETRRSLESETREP
ncbi:peptidoglycan-binding protein [Streptomyces sp. NPDC051207]|uniref:peptidoglycan-binding domain-containing protein n=1 Tax=Streptomyces sp. NPDC051207 TaxID=3154641 RepID=UPI003448AF9B